MPKSSEINLIDQVKYLKAESSCHTSWEIYVGVIGNFYWHYPIKTQCFAQVVKNQRRAKILKTRAILHSTENFSWKINKPD
jgi:hypothetical protein